MACAQSCRFLNSQISETEKLLDKSVCKNEIIKEDKAKMVDYIANRSKEELVIKLYLLLILII